MKVYLHAESTHYPSAPRRYVIITRWSDSTKAGALSAAAASAYRLRRVDVIVVIVAVSTAGEASVHKKSFVRISPKVLFTLCGFEIL